MAGLAQVGIPFTWLGMVLAISFLETPLKFRAPGITVPLGLGIGRLVFRALAIAELALAATLTAAMAIAGRAGVGAVVVVGLLWAVLAAQVAVLRPRLDHRARYIVAGGSPPRSRLHLVYIAFEGVKVVLLPVLGGVLLVGISS
ncbi:hypothetical protein ACVGOW_19880 [Pseudonocardia saturnea]